MGIFQERNGIWYARWREEGQLKRLSLETRDRKEADIRWARIRTTQDQARLAGDDPERHAAESAPLTLIAEYLTDMERRGLSEQHRNQKQAQIEKVIRSIGATTMRGLTSRRIAGALRLLSHLSPRTQNDYRAGLHGFFEWLVESGRWSRNPVTSIRPVRELDEPRRRALEPAELGRLLATAPRHRSLIYRLCAGAGLRRSEVGKLERDQIETGDSPRISLRAAGTKARRWATIPITSDLAAALDDWFADPTIRESGRTRTNSMRSRGPDAQEFWERSKPCRGLLPPVPRMKAFEGDLRAAGVAIEKGGRFVVFHSLRATFVTNLWRAGFSAGEVCRYGRFRDVKTAMRYYTSFGISDDDLARERMEALAQRIEPTIPATIPVVS